MKDLIRKLVEAYGPSGSEEQIRELIQREIEGHADETRVDALGNLIAVKHAQGDGTAMKVMLAAHMDEIGVMVTHIDEKGFCRFTSIGGLNPITLDGNRVVFANGVVGVIGIERRGDRDKAPRLDHMYIDVGAAGRDAAPVQVGDAAGFRRDFVDLGRRLVAKSFDDRIGCAVLVQTLCELEATPHEVYFVFTVQEEVGLRGATTSAYGIAPDLAIALDVTGTGDTPEAHPMAVELGKGPAVKVKDRGMVANPRVKRLLIEAAERAGVPYQLEVLEFGSTDAAAIQLAREGVPSGTLSIPTRYVHTTSEMVDYEDVTNAVALLKALLSGAIQI